ncbi:glycoside hydrolase family 2 TIM barrel-domain containing protein [Mucisphaera calidilacus]|uniref:beta-galactosidase n=1 Tax=Mucisphaera calidilacus TaxID=2527982 RepID=A0A518BX28_9BACT|nr:glycoside hydrolase family 2 TIM barrel-domain containing protein [Mucisphaera calidilacus]QDU71521.1 Beta-galactosidase [Mucisphaera calidilacus]
MALVMILLLITSISRGQQAAFTPVDTQTPTISLSGVWRFYPNASDDFYRDPHGPDKPGLTIPVPSEIETTYPDLVRGELETTGFHRTVYVPEAWSDRVIKLRFRSVEGQANVYVNGQHAGRFAGPWIPFELDVTEQIRPGEQNDVAVHVSKNPTIILSGRGFLGIGFEPELIAVPRQHIASLHLNTDLDATYTDAELQLKLVVANRGEDATPPGRIELQLADADGREVELDEPVVEVPAVAAGESAVRALSRVVKKPDRWTPETPTLYTLTTRLSTGEEPSHTTSNRVGFREIEITEDHVLLNGEVLKILSVGYHHVPSYQNLHAVTREELRRDMELMKYANFTMIRAAPFPDLIEICDEIGLMTAIETTIGGVEMSWMPHTHGLGKNETFYDDYQRMLRQLVEVFRNHPSVIAWNLGNESLFTLPAFVDGGFMLQELDPHRIVWAEAHEDEKMGKNLPQTNVDNYHYPNFVDKGMPDKRPIFYGEWAHIHEYAKGDFRTDPTVHDFWIHAYQQHIDYMHRTEKVLGGHLFYGVSFTIRMKNAWGGIVRDWGILDRYRRAKPEFWNVKKANSPLRLVKAEVSNDGQSVAFTLKNYSRFTPTRDYRWQARYRGEEMALPDDAIPAIEPMERGVVQVALASPMRSGDRFELDVISRQGRLVDRYAVGIRPDILPPVRASEVSHHEHEGEIVISVGDSLWRLSRETGLLTSGEIHGVHVLEAGPFLTATRQHTRGSHTATNWRLESVRHEKNDGALTFHVTGRYDEAQGSYQYTFKPDGQLEVNYDFTWLLANEPAKRPYHTPPDSQEMREIGITFALSPAMNTLRWDRNAHWTSYPSDHIARPVGEAPALHTRLPGYTGSYDRLPWYLESNEFGTRDFRSTRLNIRHVALRNETASASMNLYADGDQHARAYLHPDSGRVHLTIVDQYAGGHERFLQGNRIYAAPRIILNEGTRLNGSALITLE